MMKTIMIVDDHQERLQNLKSLIQEEYSVVTAPNTKEAVQRLEEPSDTPIDLILIHTQIPGTEEYNFFTLFPQATMKNQETDAFLPTPLSRDAIHEFLQKKLGKNE